MMCAEYLNEVKLWCVQNILNEENCMMCAEYIKWGKTMMCAEYLNEVKLWCVQNIFNEVELYDVCRIF